MSQNRAFPPPVKRSVWTWHRLTGILTLVIALSGDAMAQAVDLPVSEFGVLNNSVANLHVRGDSVWIGPFLNLTVDDGATFHRADSDSLFGTINRLFSIDVENDVVAAGIGRADNSNGDGVQTAAGFLISEDGGNTFRFRFPQLDNPDDTTIVFGINTLPALPIIAPQQSPPFDIDVDLASGSLWVAGWASGIRRSDDLGRSWSRVVLPPDDLDFVSPDSIHQFTVEPQLAGSGSLNHMGFSVLVDATGTVWAGTAGGLNRSTDGGHSWQRFKTDGTTSSLTGNWVISIEEQPTGSGPVVWAATWNTGDVGGGINGQFGVTYTADGGATFNQSLHGERIFDFAFAGDRVYAAGDNGLFISEDQGRTWFTISDFRDKSDPSRLVRPGSSVFSVDVTRSGSLWVGTSDGLLVSRDGGLSWTIFRTDVPVNPDVPSGRVPDVDTFAYPNPFSPSSDVFIRVKFESDRDGQADLRVFDYAMNAVRTVSAPIVAGTSELLWDGQDDRGTRVANGVYFYEVETGNDRFRGKILVIE
ncbi:MAG: hypothetical protein COV99_10110 [Bacteroidetes bacterium CG12_big_fil_rev_8_21_14_0_65_60_17]|nr:MAG: hypothetical protein COV99_10110 [Bacteroidetes bacterium CG12_big_fil_rev_8_21_14_0_65_60_17]